MTDTTRYIEHDCIRGDMWDALAFKYYSAESLAVNIMDANKDYAGVVMFEGGEKIRIPILEDTERPESLPPWLR